MTSPTARADNPTIIDLAVPLFQAHRIEQPARVHFGLPADHGPLTLTVIWPDGPTSTVTGIQPDRLLTIERST